MSKRIEWDVAEVLEYDYTYQWIPETEPDSTTNKLFALKVRSCSSYFNDRTYIAKPANINMKQIPLIGEFVLIYKTFNQESTTNRWREAWYYVSSIDIQSSMNENMLPGLSNSANQEEIDNVKPGKTFTKQSISPLQPYEGDFLIEGRFGNSIRFGNSVDTNNIPAGYYHKNPTWFTQNLTYDPIIILSNGHTNLSGKEFVVEDIERDSSSLYLTSNQQLTTLKLSRSLTVNNNFAGSQFVAIGDRIILRAKKDIAVIDAERGIILNTNETVKIGADDANEPLPHGTVLLQILNKLIAAIQLGTTGAGGPGVPIGIPELTEAATLIAELNSNKYFIKKN
jgi:hypothetical protein